MNNNLTFKKKLGWLLTKPFLFVFRVFQFRFVFRVFQSLGFHIVRNHFYAPVPDTRRLDPELWTKHSELVGIEMNADHQLNLMNEVFPKYIGECEFSQHKKTTLPYEFVFGNDFFEAVDAEVLHSFVRHFKPKKVVEIGSGWSTFVSARAALMNIEKDDSPTDVFCIEPYPNAVLSSGVPGVTELIRKPVEQLDLTFFQSLQENDILFIDSSHVLKTGSDVAYEYLEILPRLEAGVFIHIHDIFLPANYPREWIVEQHFFWTEQYLLQAFLTFNNCFEVVWGGSYMAITEGEELAKTFPSWKNSYRSLPRNRRGTTPTIDGERVWPASFWIRKTK